MTEALYLLSRDDLVELIKRVAQRLPKPCYHECCADDLPDLPFDEYSLVDEEILRFARQGKEAHEVNR